MRVPRLFLLVVCAAAPVEAQQTTGSPVAVHAGVAYAALADTEFEVVRALSGQDLFSLVRTRENRTDLAVFVSHRLWAGNAARAYGTIGTAARDFGSVIYLGGSVGVSRALVTLGLSTRLVKQGVGPVADEVFRGSSERLLFAGLQQEREWGFFIAASFSLIQ